MKTDTETLGLLERVKDGNDDAFARLAGKYRTVTESLVASFVSSSGEATDFEALADDLRQEARLALYRSAMSYDPDGDGKSVTFGLYAKICIRNALISERRRRERQKRKLEKLRLSVAHEGERAEDTADAVINHMELAQFVERAGKVLSPYETKIFREMIKGRSPREISRDVGRSEKSVSNAVYRVKTKLKASMGLK